MKLRDWFVLAFTLVVGIFAGMYLYVYSFAPIYEDRDVLSGSRSASSSVSEEIPEEFRVSVSNLTDDAISEDSEPETIEEIEEKYDRPVWSVGGYFERGFRSAGFGEE